MQYHYFTDPLTLRKYQQGPIGPYLEEFIDWFEKRGYGSHLAYAAISAVLIHQLIHYDKLLWKVIGAESPLFPVPIDGYFT